MRFMLRIISLLFLAIGIIAAIIDALKSVAGNTIALTSLGANWFDIHAESLNLSQAITQRYLHPLIWDPVMQWILLQPTAIVFLVLSLIFYMLAYKRIRPEDKFLA